MPTRNTIIWRHPLSELGGMHAHLDHLFDDLRKVGSARLAPVDVIREPQRIIVRADMPGVRSEDLHIELSDGVLSIHGKHPEPADNGGQHYVRRERTQHDFTRSLALPGDVEADQIKATCADGVVEVSIPLPAKAGAHVIPVLSGEART